MFRTTSYKKSDKRVVIVDYPLVKRDFPHLMSKSNEEIDEWLLEGTAWIHEGTLDIAKVEIDEEKVYKIKNILI